MAKKTNENKEEFYLVDEEERLRWGEYVKENSHKLGRKLLNPFNQQHLIKMIQKLPEKDQQRLMKDPTTVQLEELTEEGQEIYVKTMCKILGKKK